jgi:hypothetical protein
VKGLRWAQGQGEHQRGTRYHLVVADVYQEHDEQGRGYGYPLQRTACGHYLLQSLELRFGDHEEAYLERYHAEPYSAWFVCPKCWDFHQRELGGGPPRPAD